MTPLLRPDIGHQNQGGCDNPICAATNWAGDRWAESGGQIVNGAGDLTGQAVGAGLDFVNSDVGKALIAVGIPVGLGAFCLTAGAATAGVACAAALGATLAMSGNVVGQCLNGVCAGTESFSFNSLLVSSVGGAILGPAMSKAPAILSPVVGAAGSTSMYVASRWADGKDIDPGFVFASAVGGAIAPVLASAGVVKTLFNPKAGAEELRAVSYISQFLIGGLSGWNGQSR